MILTHTVKGWTLGEHVEARNITHQAKKMSEQELRVFRDRLELPIPDEQIKDAPYYHPRRPTPPRSSTCRSGVPRWAARRRIASSSASR